MQKLAGKLRWFLPATMPIYYHQRAGCIVFQVEQQGFGCRHGTKTEYQVWLCTIDKGVNAQESIVTGKHHDLVVIPTPQLREGISKNRIAKVIGQLYERFYKRGIVVWASYDESASCFTHHVHQVSESCSIRGTQRSFTNFDIGNIVWPSLPCHVITLCDWWQRLTRNRLRRQWLTQWKIEMYRTRRISLS